MYFQCLLMIIWLSGISTASICKENCRQKMKQNIPYNIDCACSDDQLAPIDLDPIPYELTDDILYEPAKLVGQNSKLLPKEAFVIKNPTGKVQKYQQTIEIENEVPTAAETLLNQDPLESRNIFNTKSRKSYLDISFEPDYNGKKDLRENNGIVSELEQNFLKCLNIHVYSIGRNNQNPTKIIFKSEKSEYYNKPGYENSDISYNQICHNYNELLMNSLLEIKGKNSKNTSVSTDNKHKEIVLDKAITPDEIIEKNKHIAIKASSNDGSNLTSSKRAKSTENIVSAKNISNINNNRRLMTNYKITAQNKVNKDLDHEITDSPKSESNIKNNITKRLIETRGTTYPFEFSVNYSDKNNDSYTKSVVTDTTDKDNFENFSLNSDDLSQIVSDTNTAVPYTTKPYIINKTLSLRINKNDKDAANQIKETNKTENEGLKSETSIDSCSVSNYTLNDTTILKNNNNDSHTKSTRLDNHNENNRSNFSKSNASNKSDLKNCITDEKSDNFTETFKRILNLCENNSTYYKNSRENISTTFLSNEKDNSSKNMNNYSNSRLINELNNHDDLTISASEYFTRSYNNTNTTSNEIISTNTISNNNKSRSYLFETEPIDGDGNTTSNYESSPSNDIFFSEIGYDHQAKKIFNETSINSRILKDHFLNGSILTQKLKQEYPQSNLSITTQDVFVKNVIENPNNISQTITADPNYMYTNKYDEINVNQEDNHKNFRMNQNYERITKNNTQDRENTYALLETIYSTTPIYISHTDSYVTKDSRELSTDKLISIQKFKNNHEELPENQVKIPKVLTKENINGSVDTVAVGYEDLPNNDFLKLESEDINTLISSKKNITSESRRKSDINPTTSVLNGTLYFEFNKNRIPAKFIQDENSNINVALNGNALCNTILLNREYSNTLLKKICDVLIKI